MQRFLLLLFLLGFTQIIKAQTCCTPNNHSLSFNGNTDYVELIGTSSIANFGTNNFTISHWFKSDAPLSGHFCNSLLKIGNTNHYYDLTPRGDYAGIPQFHFANGNGQDYYAVSNDFNLILILCCFLSI